MTKTEAEEILTEMRFAERLDFKTNPEFGFVYSEEKEAIDVALKLFNENKQLANRCYALTHGKLCVFCPIECDHRAKEFRGDIDNDVVSEDNEG